MFELELSKFTHEFLVVLRVARAQLQYFVVGQLLLLTLLFLYQQHGFNLGQLLFEGLNSLLLKRSRLARLSLRGLAALLEETSHLLLEQRILSLHGLEDLLERLWATAGIAVQKVLDDLLVYADCGL